jgi:hypothetical protein
VHASRPQALNMPDMFPGVEDAFEATAGSPACLVLEAGDFSLAKLKRRLDPLQQRAMLHQARRVVRVSALTRSGLEAAAITYRSASARGSSAPCCTGTRCVCPSGPQWCLQPRAHP